MELSDESSDGIFPRDIWKRINGLPNSADVPHSAEDKRAKDNAKPVKDKVVKSRKTRAKTASNRDKNNNSKKKNSQNQGKRNQKRKKVCCSESESEQNEENQDMEVQAKRRRPLRKCRIKKRGRDYRNPVEFDVNSFPEEERTLTRTSKKKNQKNVSKNKKKDVENLGEPSLAIMSYSQSPDVPPVASMVSEAMAHGDAVDVVSDFGKINVKENNVPCLASVSLVAQRDHDCQSRGTFSDLPETSNSIKDNEKLTMTNSRVREDQEVRGESSSSLSVISDLFFNDEKKNIKSAPGKKKSLEKTEKKVIVSKECDDEDVAEMSLLDDRLWSKK